MPKDWIFQMSVRNHGRRKIGLSYMQANHVFGHVLLHSIGYRV